MSCPTCTSTSWVAWTEGSRRDALDVAREISVPTRVHRCSKGGWDIVAVTR